MKIIPTWPKASRPRFHETGQSNPEEPFVET